VAERDQFDECEVAIGDGRRRLLVEPEVQGTDQGFGAGDLQGRFEHDRQRPDRMRTHLSDALGYLSVGRNAECFPESGSGGSDCSNHGDDQPGSIRNTSRARRRGDATRTCTWAANSCGHAPRSTCCGGIKNQARSYQERLSRVFYQNYIDRSWTGTRRR